MLNAWRERHKALVDRRIHKFIVQLNDEEHEGLINPVRLACLEHLANKLDPNVPMNHPIPRLCMVAQQYARLRLCRQDFTTFGDILSWSDESYVRVKLRTDRRTGKLLAKY